MKKKLIILLCLIVGVNFCFAKPKFYKTKNGNSGYAEMHYQGTINSYSIREINSNLFTISNALGCLPYVTDKLSNAQWDLFDAAYDDQYDIKKNEIYNISLKITGDARVLNMTFYFDGENINYFAFYDYHWNDL